MEIKIIRIRPLRTGIVRRSGTVRRHCANGMREREIRLTLKQMFDQAWRKDVKSCRKRYTHTSFKNRNIVSQPASQTTTSQANHLHLYLDPNLDEYNAVLLAKQIVGNAPCKKGAMRTDRNIGISKISEKETCTRPSAGRSVHSTAGSSAQCPSFPPSLPPSIRVWVCL